MADHEAYDDLILGGGKAGKTLAMDLARSGRKTALIERGMIGGSCINVACIPTKTLIRSAKVAELAGRAEEFGIEAGPARAVMAGVRRRKRGVVAGMVDLNGAAFEASGLHLIIGDGRFVAPGAVEVALAEGGTRRLEGGRVFINTGTRTAMPPIPGLALAGPLTHATALELDRLPEHLIILGGGTIGVEFAQAFRRLGSRVTIIQRQPRLLPREDPDVSEAVLAIFRGEGIDVLLTTEVSGVEGRSGDSIRLALRRSGGDGAAEGTDLLVATGRTPNTEGLGLDVAGVSIDGKGYIRVNERLETTAPGIWAMGDVAGSPQYTHVALDDYRVVKANLSGGSRTTAGRLIPSCTFIDPELGRVGLNESEARGLGLPVKVARLAVSAVPRARTLDETHGFMKAVIEPGSDRILGFTMLGAEAGEVVAAVQLAMLSRLAYTALRDGIFAHPTMAEGLNLLFSAPMR